MRISDWSSDVCSSDLFGVERPRFGDRPATRGGAEEGVEAARRGLLAAELFDQPGRIEGDHPQILRARAFDEFFVRGRVERRPTPIGVARLDIAALGRRLGVVQIAPPARTLPELARARCVTGGACEFGEAELGGDRKSTR